MRYKRDHKKNSFITLKIIDQFLEQLTTVTKEDEQLDVISNFFNICTPGLKK